MQEEESRVERVQRFSKIWWKSRADAGKSQEFLAMGIGVSKKTIRNWEQGISAPDLFQGSEWFRILGLNPMPYYLEFLFPGLFAEDVLSSEDESRIEEALLFLIRESPAMEKRELLYVMAGKHGSSWYSLLQMLTAHCHTTMRSRVVASRLILENYEMEEQTGELVCPDCIRPDLELLTDAVERGKHAVQNHESGYSTIP